MLEDITSSFFFCPGLPWRKTVLFPWLRKRSSTKSHSKHIYDCFERRTFHEEMQSKKDTVVRVWQTVCSSGSTNMVRKSEIKLPVFPSGRRVQYTSPYLSHGHKIWRWRGLKFHSWVSTVWNLSSLSFARSCVFQN